MVQVLNSPVAPCVSEEVAREEHQEIFQKTSKNDLLACGQKNSAFSAESKKSTFGSTLTIEVGANVDPKVSAPAPNFVASQLDHFEQISNLKMGAQTARRRTIKNYYKNQLNLIKQFKADKDYLKKFEYGDAECLVENNDGQVGNVKRWERFLTHLTLIVNLLLLVSQVVAVVLSGSLVVLSSVVDLAMDLVTGVVMCCAVRAMDNRDLSQYPRGRTRLEPMAIIVTSVIMGAANVQVIVQAVEIMLKGTVDPQVDTTTLIIMGSTIAMKVTLALVCFSFRKNSATIRVLMQDHRNDCLSNSMAIVCAFLATKYWKYLDPIGAIVVCLYIIFSWIATGLKHVRILSGQTAGPDIINRIAKVCLDHTPKISSVDTIYAYHFALKYLVEVHVVLDENIRLREAHDISEPLQRKIEKLPYVERAFVHVDYESTHKPQFEHKIV